MATIIEDVKAAKRVSTPILALQTYNQQDLIRTLRDSLNGVPAVRWDQASGLVGINDAGTAALSKFGADADALESSGDPSTALQMALKLPAKTCLYFVNAHSYIRDPLVATAVGNLRDPFKGDFRTLILLGPAFNLPPELTYDVVLLRDPLPTDEQLRTIATEVHEQASVTVDDKVLEQMTGAGRGLTTFGFEQQAAMSLRLDPETKELRFDVDSLWARKIETVNNTPGLELKVKAFERENIKGLDAIIENHMRRSKGPKPPRLILFIDELDKGMAGFGADGAGDNTGVTQDQVQSFLKWMEDEEVLGQLLVGVAGTGKTMVASCVAGILGIPCLHFDLGGLKTSALGESEQRIRYALEVASRIGSGSVMVMATCNRLAALPPELRRRFTEGTWFFDLLSAEARAQCWQLYSKKYDVRCKGDVGEWDEGWTGAEIRNVCRSAYQCNATIDEATRWIVPIAKSSPDEIERLRKLADNRFLDAANGGTYRRSMERAETKRRFDLQDLK